MALDIEKTRGTSPPRDTIVALATPPGEGAIAIVRLSGPESWRVASRLLARGPRTVPSLAPQPGSFRHATLRDPESGEILDSGLVLRFKAPRSFTGEDAVELQVHGSPVCTRRILETLLRNGARLAEPGEFTRRAFLNGKLNLTQAEGIIDLIRAKSDRAARLATAQLGNSLGCRIEAIYGQMVALGADLTSLLDFPDDELPAAEWPSLVERFTNPLAELEALLGSAGLGHWLREGAKVALAGPPNAGKSTLFNALAESERAIVSAEPGTTRDLLESGVQIGGIPVLLEDTAGLRETASAVEREGISRAKRAVAEADFVLAVLDASLETTDDERAALAEFDPARTLVVLNKTDLGRRKKPEDFMPFKCVETCLIPSPIGTPGVEAIRVALGTWLEAGHGGDGGEEVAVSLRHRALLSAAKDALEQSRELAESCDEGKILFADNALREAMDALAEILGTTPDSDVLDAVFSRFCIGK